MTDVMNNFAIYNFIDSILYVLIKFAIRLRKKNKRPIIYHQVNVTIDTGGLTIQLSTPTTNLSKIVMMAVCSKLFEICSKLSCVETFIICRALRRFRFRRSAIP